MSADEIDAELLAMAGDSSDDEGEEIDQTQVVDDRSPTPEAQESVEKVEEPPTIKRGVAQKVKPRGRRKRKQESEDEDGEASPSSPGSRGSAAMDESDGEIDDADTFEEDGPLFPVEGKFYDSADRERIISLPEIEREEILADRAQQVIRRQQDLQLKKALADTKAAANRHKRKADAAELEDGTRRSTRPKTEKRSALDDYRRAREQKDAERNRLESQRGRRDERSPSSASDRDADGESEVEWAEPSSNSRVEEPPAELKDFERCRLGRSNFARVCFYPGFEEAIQGCFCRVSIGVNRETGQNQYRMTQIKGFTEGKPYVLEMPSGKRINTDQYAIVAHGAAEKPWPFSACSDSKFTETEYNRFTEAMTKDGLRVPSRKLLHIKLNAIHGLLNTNFTEETLQYKFAKQRAMDMKLDPVFAAKVKRGELLGRRKAAEESGDSDEVEKCDAALAALENSTSEGNGFSKPKQSPMKSGAALDRLAQQTHANRAKNVQEVRKALLEEKRKLQRDRDAAKAKKQAALAAAKMPKSSVEGQKGLSRLANSNVNMSDLFNGSGPDLSRAATPVNGSTRTASPLNGAKKEKGPVGALKKKNMDDDVIAGLDIGIDIEI